METKGFIILLLVPISVCSAQTNIFADFVCNSFGGMFPKSCQKIDGAWGSWGPYSPCSTTCGTGTRTRTRECNNPPASNGGAECPEIDRAYIEWDVCNITACPVDGGWGSWGAYSSCTVKCGAVGTRYRERVCDNPSASDGGAPCSIVPVGERENATCSTSSCPVPGNWGGWTGFSACSRTCNGGTKERTRPCNDPSPSNGGAECPNFNTDNSERYNCNEEKCPVDGGWGSWGAFSECEKGVTTRLRLCNNPSPSNGGQLCSADPNDGLDSGKCSTQPTSTPVNGGWGKWTDFSKCSKSCGGGTKERTRPCNDPTPSNGGADCPNSITDNSEKEDCNMNPCPVDGGWGSWGAYSACTVTCGGGNRTRERVCDNPSASQGGASCPLSPVGATESGICNTDDCPVPGKWGPWSGFNACSRTCDGGTQERTRKCDEPPPSNGGADCPNNSTDNFERKACNLNQCPVDGGWGSWGPYTPCSATCGDGTYSRTRSCNNPSPSNGGQLCSTDPKDANESTICNFKPCPVDGEWGKWSRYGDCSVSCGGGVQRRTRDCDLPVASYGGARCPLPSIEYRLCNPESCFEVNCNMQGYTFYRKTFTCISVVLSGITYDESATACGLKGATLVTMDTYQKYSLISRSMANIGATAVYIGARYIDDDYRWSNQKRVTWIGGHPFDTKPCVQIVEAQFGFDMMPVSCDSKSSYACELTNPDD